MISICMCIVCSWITFWPGLSMGMACTSSTTASGILNDSYGIWRAYATHLNDVYDIAWVLMIHMLYDKCMLRNPNDALWYVYETVHPYDVECGSYATEYPYDVCMRHLNEWVWKFNIWLRMMSNDIQMVLGKKWPIFREETTLLPYFSRTV